MKKKQCSGGNAYKSMSSGLSVKRWCKENHVSSPSFYYWKKRLEKKQSETSEETMPNYSGNTSLCSSKKTTSRKYGKIEVDSFENFDSGKGRRKLLL